MQSVLLHQGQRFHDHRLSELLLRAQSLKYFIEGRSSSQDIDIGLDTIQQVGAFMECFLE